MYNKGVAYYNYMATPHLYVKWGKGLKHESELRVQNYEIIHKQH